MYEFSINETSSFSASSLERVGEQLAVDNRIVITTINDRKDLIYFFIFEFAVILLGVYRIVRCAL